MHYFIILLPLLFLFLTMPFSYLFSSKNRLLQVSGLMIFSALILSAITFDAAFFDLVRKRKAIKGDYGTIFAVTETNIKKRIKMFKNQKDYQEILLTSHLPLSQMIGFNPVNRMLNPTYPTEKEIIDLEKRFIQQPYDPRLKYQIFTYYTREQPTQDTIAFLKMKSSQNPLYKELYQEVANVYRNITHKREYVSNIFHFSFYYPEHWVVEENQESIIITGDDTATQIALYEENSDNITKKSNTFEKHTCVDENQYWCGTEYYPIIGSKKYKVTVAPAVNISATDEKLPAFLKVIEEIIGSIRQ